MAGKSQSEWVLQIGELLRRDDLQAALEFPTSIFKLPDSVTGDNPEAYSPSRLLLGPYHDINNPELQKMEIVKLENAKMTKEKFQLPEFAQMVEELKKSELQIRSCYDKNFEMGSEALTWKMLIDGLFLLRLVGIFHDDEEDDGKKKSDPRLDRSLPVFTEQQLYLNLQGNITKTQNAEIVKDILKLENQIPFQVLRKLLPRNLSYRFGILLYKFCVSVSPLPLPPYNDDVYRVFIRFCKLSEVADQSQHLLHFLYALIFYGRFRLFHGGGMSEQRSGSVFEIFEDVLNAAAKVVEVGFLQQLVQAVGLIKSLILLLGRVRQLSFGEDNSIAMFPSASELRKVGVKFDSSITFGDGCRFDKEETTLRLRRITINAYSEVILRNLVAFEREAKLNPPWLSHYVTLMSGLMATAKDVKILKKADIVVGDGSRSDEDEQVVKLFKELRDQSRVKDKARSELNSLYNFEVQIMEEINQYYENRWRVKAERFAKRRICPLFQALIIIIVLLLIAIVAIRLVCGWFSCPKILGHVEIFNGGYYTV